MDRIVVVMPTFKEAENIGKMIDELVGKEFPTIKGADMQLLVVDANSPDGTGKIVQEKQKEYKNLHLLSKEKGGLGADYVAGFKYAVGELDADAVMEMDADGHPKVNISKARQIKIDRIRVERDVRLAATDVGVAKLDGAAIPAALITKRQAL